MKRKRRSPAARGGEWNPTKNAKRGGEWRPNESNVKRRP